MKQKYLFRCDSRRESQTVYEKKKTMKTVLKLSATVVKRLFWAQALGQFEFKMADDCNHEFDDVEFMEIIREFPTIYNRSLRDRS